MITPENIEIKKLEFEIEEKKTPKVWKSGCLLIDRNAVVFFSTLFISLIVITFCIFKLTYSESCEAQNTYIGLLTLVLGIWIKSPSF